MHYDCICGMHNDQDHELWSKMELGLNSGLSIYKLCDLG
jgi:hypothetical protein